MNQKQEVLLKKKLMSFIQLKQFQQAERVAQQILHVNPEDLESWFFLAQAQQALDNPQAALFAYMRSVARPSAHTVKALDPLTLICIQNGLFEDGLKGADYWLQIEPKSPTAFYRKGYCLIRLKKSILGALALEQAHKLHPESKDIHNTLAEVIAINGEGDRALFEYEKGRLFEDNFARYARYLEFHNYSETISEENIFKHFCEFGRKLESEIKPLESTKQLVATGKKVDKSSQGKIKIGYLSPDFKSHSVAHFLKPIFESHNKQKFFIAVYSDTQTRDDENEFFRRHADSWCDSTLLDDDALAHKIKEEKVDILIDLAGFTAVKCRMRVFAMKPAPIQVNYLGFPNTSGLSRMDYRLVDSITDPEGVADRYNTEQLIRLSPTFLCFSQYKKTPSVNPLPALKKGHITFGSFNNGQKLTDELLTLWGKILISIPHAKLIIKNSIFVDDEAKQEYLKRCVKVGLDTKRVRLLGFIKDTSNHLEVYHEVDIHLDSYPYSGTTTTFEALWMGVPSITLEGAQHRSRVTSSIQAALGLDNFTAKTKEEYCQLAVKMSNDQHALQTIRTELRAKLQNSLMMDKVAFTKQLECFFEAAYHAYPEKITHL